MKSNISKLNRKIDVITRKMVDEKFSNVTDRLSNECHILINQLRKRENDLAVIETKNIDYIAELEIDFPDYNTFVNFFNNAVSVLADTTNAYLIDQIIKLVFLNIIVGDKEVLGYTLNEPFSSYQIMKFQYGVDNRT